MRRGGGEADPSRRNNRLVRSALQLLRCQVSSVLDSWMGDSSDPRRQPGQELAASADAVAHAATPSRDSTEDGASPRGGYDPADYRWVTVRRRERLDGGTRRRCAASSKYWRIPARSAPPPSVRFVRPPAEQPYGPMAVFEDLYGSLWDLVQPANQCANPPPPRPT